MLIVLGRIYQYFSKVLTKPEKVLIIKELIIYYTDYIGLPQACPRKSPDVFSCIFPYQKQVTVLLGCYYLSFCPLQNLPEVSGARLWKMNAPEWPYILVGGIAATVNGAIQPLFAIVFAEILGVSMQHN